MPPFNVSDSIQLVILITSFIAGVVTPVTLYLIHRRESQHSAAWNKLVARVEHIDECVDEAKVKAAESTTLIRAFGSRIERIEDHLMARVAEPSHRSRERS